MKSSKAVTALSALAQETRLRVFKELVKSHSLKGETRGIPVGVLVKKLKIAPATLSFHLKELSNAGLITSKRDGRSIYYQANFSTMQALIEHLLKDCCGGVCGIEIVQSSAAV